jgi:hypothetical protein
MSLWEGKFLSFLSARRLGGKKKAPNNAGDETRRTTKSHNGHFSIQLSPPMCPFDDSRFPSTHPEYLCVFCPGLLLGENLNLNTEKRRRQWLFMNVKDCGFVGRFHKFETSRAGRAYRLVINFPRPEDDPFCNSLFCPPRTPQRSRNEATFLAKGKCMACWKLETSGERRSQGDP